METIDILKILPHRQPMLMVDKVLKLTDTQCVALKNISYSDPIIAGHFPEKPIFPGALIVEALAQTCVITFSPPDGEKLPIFAGIQNARFKKPVFPGDQLKMTGTLIETNGHFFTFEAIAETDAGINCTAILTIYY